MTWITLKTWVRHKMDRALKRGVTKADLLQTLDEIQGMVDEDGWF